MTTKTKGPDYVRASRLRKRVTQGEELEEDDAAWFESYESAKGKQGRPPINASASEKITYTEERSAAQGDHPHPIAYEGMVRAEGLRADTLLRIVADALIRVNDQYATMNAHLLQRTTAIEEAHVAMLHEVREHFLARVNAEAEAIQLQQLLQSGGEGGGELGQLLGYLMQAKAQADATPEGQRKLRARQKARQKATKKTEKPLGSIE